MKARSIVLTAAMAVCACASTGEGQRTTLAPADLEQIKPQIAAHRLCVASKVREFIGSTADVQLMVNTAIQNCRGKLGDVATGLDQFNLEPAAKRRYLNAVETTARSQVTELLLKAQASAARKRSAEQRQETLTPL